MVEILGILGLLGFIALAIAELVLRRVYGLGQPPLYVADTRTGYRLAPNQSVRRFGNRIQVNQYSMRGDPITPPCPQTTLR
ncbi:lipolytic protein G-D-S-L family, partial [filamentous cyanobacterium CCP5]